jgi:hypothetical protein
MHSRHSSWLPLVLLTALVLLCLAEPALACPTCKDSVDAHGENLARGYAWSIIFMLSMPFLICGGLSLYFYLLVRSARARQAGQSPPPVEMAELPSNMIAAK